MAGIAALGIQTPSYYVISAFISDRRIDIRLMRRFHRLLILFISKNIKMPILTNGMLCSWILRISIRTLNERISL
jgi:hypothetical protein